jgi:hypothetical protein
MNSVDSLLKQPFSSRSLEEKVEIKTLGRLMPNLNIVQTAKGSEGREVSNALFCCPCLLFGSNDSWSRGGIKDLGHVNEYAKNIR